MIQYHVSLYQASRHRIKVSVNLPTPTNETILRISAWRPGRYEEGNFSRLITNLQAFNGSTKLTIQKIEKYAWLVDTTGINTIQLSYLYYGAELTAGNTYLDESLLLINPVNLLIYSNECLKDSLSLILDLPSHWKYTGLAHKPNQAPIFNSLDELFDSPILASPTLSEHTYAIDSYQFVIAIHAEHNVKTSTLLEDFKRFTREQILGFGEFPTQTFTFLVIGINEKYLHGVEHLNSTVIALGPSNQWHKKRYEDLLSVASHELYHVWNIKTIRPADMLPYCFERPNYSRLGYIYEGITTYLGDYYLLKAGLITPKRFIEILQKQIQTHIDNMGRFAYSVADSSVDTWVDGYVSGTPGRKVSIYNEGSLMAFIIDTRLRKTTNHKATIQTFMNRLYYEFGLRSKGYAEADLILLLNELSGSDFTDLFNLYINGAQGYESLLQEALSFYAIEMTQEAPTENASKVLGIKTATSNQKTKIISIAPGSPADLGGLSEGDELVAVNETLVKGNLEKVLATLDYQLLTVKIERKKTMYTKEIPLVQRTFYPNVKLNVLSTDQHQIRKNKRLFGL